MCGAVYLHSLFLWIGTQRQYGRMISDIVRSVCYTGRADQDSNHGTLTEFQHRRDSMFYILIHTYLNTDQRKYIDVLNDSDHHKCTERQSTEKENEF